MCDVLCDRPQWQNLLAAFPRARLIELKKVHLSPDFNELNFSSRKIEKGREAPEAEREKKEISQSCFKVSAPQHIFFFLTRTEKCLYKGFNYV